MNENEKISVKDFVKELCKQQRISKNALSGIFENGLMKTLPYVIEKNGIIYFKLGDSVSPVFNIIYQKSFFLKRVKSVIVLLCSGEGLDNYMEEDLMSFMKRHAISYHYKECSKIENYLESLRKDKEQTLIRLAEEKAKVNMLLSY